MRCDARTLVLAVLLPLLPAAVAAQGTIRGRLADSVGAPVPQAMITIDELPLRTTSDDRGAYALARVPAGTWTVRVRRIGYAAPPAKVRVRDGESTTQDFTLQPVAAALAAVEVITGSRAQHTAADELPVPVDVFPMERIREQGTMETAQILSQLAPSINFQRQSVSDATEIVRPFTMRGMSPDHTLVLVNGKRQHHTALVHYFGAGMPAGSSGVDLNALPASVVGRLEVLRDGAASQYGSDAIAGVVNIVPREGAFAPTVSVEAGEYLTSGIPNRGTTTDGGTVDVNGSWGLPLGRGSVALFAEYRDRNPTNRAGADPSDMFTEGDHDSVDARGTIIQKNNAIAMPNYHWGDGASNDLMTFLNAKYPLGVGNAALYAFGGYSHRLGTGFGYFRAPMSERNWTQIYPNGFLPEFHPTVVDGSGAAGVRGTAGTWNYDVGGSFGYNSFVYDLEHTLNASLGPCLDTPCAPGPDGVLGTADDPGIPNKTRFNAGELKLWESIVSLDVNRTVQVGLPSPLSIALGAAFRRENYQVIAGEPASYMQGYHPDQYGDVAAAGSQVFPGIRPQDEADANRNNLAGYVELESDIAPKLLANVAGRFEHYSDFGSKVTGKLALRFQPTSRLTLRSAISTGFRAPSLNQSFYSQIATNFVPDPVTGAPVAVEVGIFPVASPEARALGARPLKPENSVNFSGGLAFSPIPNITFTADYFWIRLADRIMLTTLFGGDSVERILQSVGSRAQAAQYMTNGLTTRTQGVDVTGTYRFALGSGTVGLNGAFNWTQNKISDISPLPPELNGTDATSLFDPYYEGGLNAILRERPKWRSTITATYDVAPWSFLARSSSYGKYTSSLYGYSREAAQTYPSKALVDAEVGYTFRGSTKLSVGARNLFDTYPGFMSIDNGFFIFPYPSASPFGFNGRFIYTRLEFGLGR